jgi:3-keto steroid reductase
MLQVEPSFQLCPLSYPLTQSGNVCLSFKLSNPHASGIGLATGERLIDEFLDSRPLTSHLILIPTTRSQRKSRETIDSLRAHLHRAAQTSKGLQARAGADHDWRDAVKRVHVLSIQIDLCDLLSVYKAAEQLVSGTISVPPGGDPEEEAGLANVRIPRLDAVVFNAGFGGWSGLNWPRVFQMIFTQGIVQSVTWPTFKIADPGAAVKTKFLKEDQVFINHLYTLTKTRILFGS